MKKVLLTSFILACCTNTFANNKFAERLVIAEIEKYAADYQVEELVGVKYLGIQSKKYLFDVQYTKNFCANVGDDERMYCATYRCESVAEVDSDAVVSFESEAKASACKKIPGTDFTQSW
jgi:hypothetical protein